MASQDAQMGEGVSRPVALVLITYLGGFREVSVRQRRAGKALTS